MFRYKAHESEGMRRISPKLNEDSLRGCWDAGRYWLHGPEAEESYLIGTLMRLKGVQPIGSGITAAVVEFFF